MQLVSAIKRLRWQASLLLTIFFICFFVLFIGLGIWQLQRVDEKRLWLESRQNAQHGEHQLIEALPTAAAQEFATIAIAGQFDQKSAWLLENQTVHGKVGYDLIAPLVMQNGQAILVNLGWQSNPVLAPWLGKAGQPVVISGTLRKPYNLPFVSNFFSAQQNAVIELVPAQFPFSNLNQQWYLQIDPLHPLAQVTHWQSPTTTPEKHFGYALQWFSMAAILAVAFLFASTNLVVIWRQQKLTKTNQPV